MKCIRIGLVLLASLALCGCAEYRQIDAEYGHSYAAMVREQTFNPRAAAMPRAPAPADGARLEKVIKAHNGAVSAAVTGTVRTGQFDVGGSGGGGGGGGSGG